MKHLLLLSTLFFILVLMLVSCGKKSDSSRKVKRLSKSTQLMVNKKLEQGQLVSPKDLENPTTGSQTTACQGFISELPESFIKDYIEVPENPAEPEGRKIKVFYYGKIKPEVAPVVFFNGGPGGSSHSSYNIFDARQWRLDPTDSLSFIYIDQRGNGCSDFYPQGDSPEILERLRHYGSRGIVADAEAIRKKLLGDKPWLAFGQSYGAFINHRYVMLAPKSLKATFSHANVINNDGYQRIKTRIRSQHRVLKKYLEQFPDDKVALEVLHEKLTSEVCFEDEETKDKACGHDVLSSIPTLLAFSDEWHRLHNWIQLMINDKELDEDGIKLFLSTYYFGEGNASNSQRWASKVIGWVDRNVPPMNSENCERIADELEKEEGIDLRSDGTHECADGLNYGIDNKDLIKVRELTTDHLTVQDFAKQLASQPQLKFYLYSGDKDQTVPVETFKEELDAIKGLPNVHYYNFSGTGHDGYYTEPKIWRDMVSELYYEWDT